MKRRFFRAFISLCALMGVFSLALCFFTPAFAENPILVLQALDKVTARVSTLKIPIGEVAEFGTLSIHPRACFKAPDEETPETAAFLEVYEERPEEEPATRFSGWMFASSPALSAMEHPVYDLVVLACENALIRSFQNPLPPSP